MTLYIRQFDPASEDESVLRSAHEAFLDRERYLYPTGPETPYDYRRVMWDNPSGVSIVERWTAFEGEELAGVMTVVTWDDQPVTGLVIPAVKKTWEGRGVASALGIVALDYLTSLERTKLIVDIPEGSRAEGFANRLGLKHSLTETVNRLETADIDWDLMAAWTGTLQSRAPGYRIEFWQPPFPEDRLEEWCRLSEAMNTAPFEDLDIADFVMTPKKWRGIEKAHEARQQQFRAAIAIEEASGELAGMTSIWYEALFPELAIQNDTVVIPDHRGSNLGRIMKAKMAKRFTDEFPAVRTIETGNAGSNAPMLKINFEMGFKTVLEIGAWQGQVATARSVLAAS